MIPPRFLPRRTTWRRDCFYRIVQRNFRLDLSQRFTLREYSSPWVGRKVRQVGLSWHRLRFAAHQATRERFPELVRQRTVEILVEDSEIKRVYV